ncbi:hypothetical protein [Nitrosomonas sp. Nm33]|uniref:hypothetical protein n=1 Tax=Nitrosomonas sp. Nm33 TaxID=133724 RepID=UPI00089B8F95|nr:hypothetical protein [Nitrosomonas sp. Nm33]SDY58474.1 hypothetical protein SAMN05421755_103135 [Nitrosomonas sp. Nm33]
MGKIVSDESLRRALSALAPGLPKRCDEAQRAACLAQVMKSAIWMDTALSESTREALSTAWILDADTSVKLLYGRQIGAEIGYNPRKPGRPSHTLHTYWISNVRLVLDVEVQNGKSHAPKRLNSGNILYWLPMRTTPWKLLVSYTAIEQIVKMALMN